jgi:triosephosphate isomerase
MINKNDIFMAVKDALYGSLRKKLIIAGNWKMNMTISEGKKFLTEMESIKTANTLVIFPPYTSLAALSGEFRAENIHYGPQSFHYKESGAYTGEISIPMLQELGCDYALTGHSERRAYYNETDKEINKKVHAGVKYGLNILVCIGENLEQRRNGTWKAVIKEQITEDLHGITQDMLSGIIVAYEPVWAIGTGVSASLEEIRETHDYIKGVVRNMFGRQAALLYGGSVNEKNVGEISKIENVDGFLIGGASLKPEAFKKIIGLLDE